jgi:hypothetical protein
MSNVLNYLITARRCEVEELQRLARTCQLVLTVSKLIHCLQQERGISISTWARAVSAMPWCGASAWPPARWRSRNLPPGWNHRT